MRCSAGWGDRRWFGYQHAGIRPDVVTLAKGLGGGVPIGACMVGRQGGRALRAGQSRLDFWRQPVGLHGCPDDHETIEQDDLIANAEKVGDLIRK